MSGDVLLPREDYKCTEDAVSCESMQTHAVLTMGSQQILGATRAVKVWQTRKHGHLIRQ